MEENSSLSSAPLKDGTSKHLNAISSLLKCVQSDCASFHRGMSIKIYESYDVREEEHAVVSLIEALYYKPEGRGFDSRCGYWNFQLT
jgi:hypothetical protein